MTAKANIRNRSSVFEVIPSETSVQEDWVRAPDSQEGERLFNRAKRAMQEQDYWSAIELCRQAIELDENNDPARYHLLSDARSRKTRNGGRTRSRILRLPTSSSHGSRGISCP